MKKILRITLVIFTTMLIGCASDQLVRDENENSAANPLIVDVLGVPSGAFKYVGYDRSGSVVSVGWLRFNPNQRRFRGKWVLYANGDEGVIGPQNGSGTLMGISERRSSSYRISINLNPTYADHNVYINGNLTNDSFAGNWGYGSIVGEVNGGKFHAVKQP